MTLDDSAIPSAGGRLEQFGVMSWRLLGVIALAVVVSVAIAALSRLVIPLIIATVIGILAVPLVDRLGDRGVPRRPAAIGVIVALLVVFVGAFAIAAAGIADQSGRRGRRLTDDR